jgi:hypothetical protein
VFFKNLSPSAPALSSNDSLRLGSTFHGLYAIASQIAPVAGAEGINKIETSTFVLECLQTLTGIKFVVTAVPGTTDILELLNGVYKLYSDYVLKNPFYEMDMPVRCDLFNEYLDSLVVKASALQDRRRGITRR